MSYGKIDIHDFYCLQCGNRALSIVRPQAHRREQFHRKKLYCPHCRVMINTIETKSDEEVYMFKEAFSAGVFVEEAKLSLEECAGNQVGL